MKFCKPFFKEHKYYFPRLNVKYLCCFSGTWAAWHTAARQRSCVWWAIFLVSGIVMVRISCLMPHVVIVYMSTSTVFSKRLVQGWCLILLLRICSAHLTAIRETLISLEQRLLIQRYFCAVSMVIREKKILARVRKIKKKKKKLWFPRIFQR